MEEDKMKNSVSRRSFIKGAALGAGAIAVAGIGGTNDAYAVPPPKKWDRKADVVVVGAGGAGLMAAVRAKDAGANVVVLQKTATVYTASTAVSGGLFAAAGTRAQKEKGIQDSAELFYQDFLKNGGFMNIPELARLLTANSVTVFEWLVDNGLPSFRFEPYPGHSVLRGHRSNKNSGRDLLDTVFAQVKKRNIPVEFGTEVKRLYVDLKGRVVGVEAAKARKTMNIQANRAVVVACGGFVRDAATFDSWIPAYSGVGNLTGDPGNVGQGIKMIVKDAGGMPTHLQYAGTYPYGLEVSPRSGPVCRYWYFTPLGAILVNKMGKRYVNETIVPTKLTLSLAEQPEKVHYLITTKGVWDEVFAKYPPGGVISPGSPDWIEKELQAGKWLYRTNTLPDLAEKIGIDAGGLAKTVETFNDYVQAGKDADFGRDPNSLAHKIEEGPFYAVKMTFATVLTLGGIRVNDKCQVVDPYGKTVPGLYAAGETTGGVHGNMYMGGCSLAWAFTSGWFAGSNAAKEKA
jgi:fumarate reductase flavoprotein subunit